MKTIYKYRLEPEDDNDMVLSKAIDMPTILDILRIDKQENSVMVWAMVETDSPVKPKKFAIYGTGREINPCLCLKYINTFFTNNYVWHAFEIE